MMGSFNDEYQKLRKKRLEEQAVTRSSTPYQRLLTPSADISPETKNVIFDDIAPVAPVTEEAEKDKWYEGWFKQGNEDTGTTVGATVGDFFQDAGTGLIGIGEKAWDFVLTLANLQAKTQQAQNMESQVITSALIGDDPEKVVDNYHNDIEALDQATAELIKQDLYNEQDIANKILAGAKTAGDWFSTFDWDSPYDLGSSYDKNYRYIAGNGETPSQMEMDSVFDVKMDSLNQSAGQVAGTAALASVGVPWWVTSGATAWGSETESALLQGATMEEATVSGLVSASAEVLTEKLSGISFGGKTITDVLAQKLAQGISSKFGRALLKAGIDTVGEGFEEALTEDISNFGRWLSYQNEEELRELLWSEEAMDAKIEAFIGGAALGGGSNIVSSVNSFAHGVDPVTELTTNEQAVFDKVYNSEIEAKAKEKGADLTKKEKAEIYDKVMNDLKKGYISTDTIEEVLGGDDYSNYKNELKRQEDINNELKELSNIKKSDLTTAQEDRIAELKGMKPNTELVNSFKFGIDEKIRTALTSERNGQGSYLYESYNEQTRKGQAFEADLSKYDTKQAEVIKTAIDSGILNNTNRTHDFVDMVAKISADKGVPFDFTNNAKLKESGFAVDGKFVNGFYSNGGITVNIDSAKYHNSVVGHEITHVLEGTELYNELQNTIIEYAKSKGEYQSRYEALQKLYESVEGADINAELTADLVGDYLFEDADFINHLSTANRNVFQKIYDEIKYLCKVATAGSKQARELEKVKRAFDKAYRESGKTSGDTKYSLDGKGNGYDGYSMSNNARSAYESGEKPWSKWTKADMLEAIKNIDESKLDIAKSMSVDDLKKSVLKRSSWHHTSKYYNKTDFYSVDTELIEVIDKHFDYDLMGYYENTNATRENGKWVYDGEPILYTPKSQIKYSLSDSDGKQLTKEQSEYFKDSKMRDDNGNLKVMYHGSQDAGFHIFDSNMSDDDTSLFFVDRNDVAASYSGTYETYEAKAFRTVEDANKFFADINKSEYEVVENDGKYTLLDNGDEIATSDDLAEIYEEFCDYEGVGYGDANYKVYLNITNPLEIDAKGRPWNKIDAEFSQEVYDKYKSLTAEEKAALVDLAEWEDFRIFNSEIQEAQNNELASAYKKMGEDVNIYDLFSVAADNFSEESMRENARHYLKTRDFAQRAKDGGYDGVIFKNIHDNGGYSNGSEGASTVAIAFNSNQIKSVANEKPTANKDIRYSLSETDYKQKQFEIIQETNPMWDDYHTGIRSADDIHTWAEVLEMDDDIGQFVWGDFSRADAEQALKDGTITVYSSKPIKNGVFVSTSYVQAQEYAGGRNGKVYSKTIPLTAVAWINGDEGQYAPVKTNTRSSLSDSEGNEISPAVQKRFANSKVVDENGHLKVVYHGTAMGEFTIFDKAKGSVEGDFGSGFYFSDSEVDVSQNYEGGGPDFENKVWRRAEQIFDEDPDIQMDEAKVKAKEELYKGNHKFKVYLNIENPAIVGETILFDNESYLENYNEEDYDDYDDYIGDVEQLVADDIDSIIWDIERNIDLYSNTDGIRNVLYDAYYEGGVDIETLKEKINGLYLEGTNGDLVGNEVTRQIIESLGYDGIIDSTVTRKFKNMGMEEGTTHYIVFKPNQIKSITNQSPTDNPDIRYSLSETNEAPTKKYGNYTVRGEDIRLNIAPVGVAKNATTTEKADGISDEIIPEGYAPIVNSYTIEQELDEINNEFEILAAQATKIKPDDTDAQNALQARYNELLEKSEQLKVQFETLKAQEEAEQAERLNSYTEADIPAETERAYIEADTTPLDDKTLKRVTKGVRDILSCTPKENKLIREVIEKYSTSEQTTSQLFKELRENFGDKYEFRRYSDIAEVKKHLKKTKFSVSDHVKGDIADYRDYKKLHGFGESKNALSVDVVYEELSGLFPGVFSSEITNETDRLERIAEVYDMPAREWVKVAELSDNEIMQAVDFIHNEVVGYRNTEARKAAEADARAYIDDIAPSRASEIAKIESDPTLNYQGVVHETKIKTVKERLAEKLSNVETELADNKRLRADSIVDFNREIARLQEEYNSKANKNTKAANDILRRIERLQTMKNNVDADYEKRISDLEAKAEKMNSATYQTAMQRQSKTQEYAEWAKKLIGDTTNWVDKKLGISYKVNTLKRNLRDVVRDAQGNRDIEKADAIYDELQGTYNHNEAELNRESNRIKKVFADMKITAAEDVYIQMLGEFMYNPETTLTPDDVNNYYEANKSKIDQDKVNEAIKLARANYDSLLERVNEVLREQGMKEIPYRKGYFPHFTDTKQSWLAKLFNWKTQDTEIPTSIAGLTEQFTPNRSWQSFNKQRFSDATDYSFTKGFDTYVQGALDWIYHIEDIQKRRAFENELRYIHSEKGIQDKVEALFNNEEYDADELQEQIDLVYREARNPLNNFVTDLHAGTNKLASKKSSMDRGMEELTNRKFYSTMTNLSNRVSANMVGGSVSSALTNFIPITQSWGEVSPVSSLRAMGETIRAAFKDDGVIDKSDFLTNRLKKSENLYKTTWDKVTDGLGVMMEGIDNFTSQTVWRSKYLENIANGMGESEAIKNADQFAEGVMAGRSRGNQPTLFDSKNPLIKTLTAFQLEVNNQYGYMFKDMPQDMKNESTAKLVKGYAAMFIGAYAYNALYSALTGRDAAFDPIGIIQELLGDLFDDEEEKEPIDAVLGFAENVAQEIPFVGGLLGGGRVPISSALPYDGNVMDLLEGTANALKGENVETATKEWLRPLYYLAMPMGGGQLKKTIEGLSMFSDEHPIAGSYTDSGSLRFPVDETFGNMAQAAIFGQYASQNARDYFDNDIAPLNEKQTQEFIDVGMSIQDYWDYREGLKQYSTLAEKADYINSLDLTDEQKNVLINNIADRKEDIDMSDYSNYGSFEEFDFASKNREKYDFWKQNGISYEDYASGDEDTKAAYNWAYENPDKFTLSKAVTDNVVTYRQYTKELNDLKADKDEDGKSISGSRKTKVVSYLNNLDIDYGAKIILFKSEYPADDTYNVDIVNYLNSRDDISYEQMETILIELGFKVDSNGRISWD